MMTPAYRRWRVTFALALARLARQQATRALAQALELWRLRYEAQSPTGLPDGAAISPLFARRQVQALVPPPPAPSFTVASGYKVVLPWNGAVYLYAANPVPAGHPFLLHAEGIRDGGTPVRRRNDIAQLFAEAGIQDACAREVLIAVSELEGGFDAVNTWDTGYVSVGFIQFITGQTGEGNSLLQVLTRMKDSESRLTALHPGHRDEFAEYFTDHGIDVRDGILVVRDPMTGLTHSGAEAVQLIIEDKRLTAIFQDAGAKSTAFQIAQIREAYGAYYLAREHFRIPVVEVCEYNEVAAPTPPEPAAAAQAPANPPRPTTITSAVATSPVPATPPVAGATHYVYGEAALQLMQGQVSRGATRAHASSAPSRVLRRLPDLVGCYGEIFTSEHGRVILTDRAVQWGVRNVADTFAKALNTLPQNGHPFTVTSLRPREAEYLQLLHNRVAAEATPQ